MAHPRKKLSRLKTIATRIAVPQLRIWTLGTTQDRTKIVAANAARWRSMHRT
jgi:hypothetical protein